jgi:hypothetical protein
VQLVCYCSIFTCTVDVNITLTSPDPDDDLSFSASEHESAVELPDGDRNALPQFEGEIRWMPKGDPRHLMVTANENFTIEMGEELNFFDTFAPQNLEVLEADNYEDYKKYFCDKGTCTLNDSTCGIMLTTISRALELRRFAYRQGSCVYFNYRIFH